MHTATGTLTAHQGAFHVENRLHPVQTAALRGAAVGALIGIVIFGILLLIAGVPILAVRYMTLYLCGIAMCTTGGAGIAALWNIGADEANRQRQ